MAGKSDLTKTAMVEKSLDTLGFDAPLDDVLKHIKTEYGVVMTKGHLSQTKSSLRRSRGMKPARKGGKRRRTKVAAATATTAAPVAATASLEQILAFVNVVNQWQAKIGAESVKAVLKSTLNPAK